MTRPTSLLASLTLSTLSIVHVNDVMRDVDKDDKDDEITFYYTCPVKTRVDWASTK